MSWRPEVQGAGESAWTPNGLRFATKTESDNWGLDLLMRWTGAQDIRSVEVTDPVNYAYIEGKLVPVGNPVDNLCEIAKSCEGKPLPTFDIYYGEDGTLVVHVETDGVPETEKGPIIRVYLNDETVFENPPYPNG